MSRPTPGSHSPAPAKGSAAKGGQPHPQPSQTAAATGSSVLVKEISALVSQPVRLGLEDGRQHIGLLWACDIGMDVVVLEIPKAAMSVVSLGKSEEYPSTAAAYPTSTLSSLKVAAQGGDASGSRTNFQIIKLRNVAKVERLQGAGAAALEKAKMTEITRDVNVAAAEARERAATSEALKRAARIGVGVSNLGQDVFDALNKTLPCRWADRHIIVMDEIVISPDNYSAATVPQYQLATLQALAEGKQVAGVAEDAKAKATRWQRVSKVLDGERKKILAKNASATPAPAAQA